jgi:hypothetical protein
MTLVIWFQSYWVDQMHELSKESGRSRHPDRLARQAMLESLCHAPKYSPEQEQPAVNPSKTHHGRRGGPKGGLAHVAALGPRKQPQIAVRAVTAQWGKHK